MVISPYISTFIKSLAMINYVCIYIIKMHLFDNYNAEYFTNNYNAESITSVEKMNYHQWAQQNASVGVTCALLLTSHFSMFERYRNCETFCNFYAILFFFLAKCFIAYQDQIHASSCYTGFKWISIAVWDHISTGSILEYVQQSFGLFPWTLFIFEHFYLSVVFFSMLAFSSSVYIQPIWHC